MERMWLIFVIVSQATGIGHPGPMPRGAAPLAMEARSVRRDNAITPSLRIRGPTVRAQPSRLFPAIRSPAL